MKKIKLLATGGTIAAKIDKEIGAAVQALTGEDLVKSVPGLSKLTQVDVESVFNIPGGHIHPNDWLTLLAAIQKASAQEDIEGIVITHGTDTIEETAYFLDLVVETQKPIVITGAQRNSSIFDSDGPRNILEACRVAISPEAWNKGVMVVFNSEIHTAREVTKTHTVALQTFQSFRYGMIGEVIGEKVRFYRETVNKIKLPIVTTKLPRVDIVPVYAGADGIMVEAAIRANAQGIVIQGLGAGNVNMPIYSAVEKALRCGSEVVIASRVPQGNLQPIYGWLGGGATLIDIGAILSGNLSPQKARILLMVAMAAKKSRQEIMTLFD